MAVLGTGGLPRWLFMPDMNKSKFIPPRGRGQNAPECPRHRGRVARSEQNVFLQNTVECMLHS